MRKLPLCLLPLLLPACSTIVEGHSQELAVNTTPPGASCVLNRKDQTQPLATITPTPGSATVEKTKYDITIVCNKAGYDSATFINHSGAAGATFGNIILGGGIGWAVDSATGSDNKYDSPVNITLSRKLSQATEPAAPAQ